MSYWSKAWWVKAFARIFCESFSGFRWRTGQSAKAVTCHRSILSHVNLPNIQPPTPPNPSLGKALPTQVSMFTSAKLIRASTINHGEHLSWTLHFLCSLCQLQLLLWLLRLHIFSIMCFFGGCLPWHVVVSELFYQQHLLDSSLPDALVSRSRLTMHNLY